MKNFKFQSVGEYTDPQLRTLAIGIKNGDMKSIIISASLMSPFVDGESLLVPMPSRHGYATGTLKLANFISKKTGAEVLNIMKGRTRESFCELKRKGETVEDDFFGFYLSGAIPTDKNIIIIDNVIATGQTATNAVRLIPDSSVLVLAS